MLAMSRPPTGWASRPCVGTPLELWFGPHESSQRGAPAETHAEQSWRERRALDICASCPFTERCLADELSLPISHQWGVRGGTTARDRRALLRARRVAASAGVVA